MKSIWENNLEKPNFNILQGDKTTDVLIIGGGMSGILCGYFLKQAGVDCITVEENSILSGVTKNTTAKISAHHGAIYDRMRRRCGTEFVSLYLRAHLEALESYRALAEGIDCDFEIADSFVYSKCDQEKLEREAQALTHAGVDVSFTQNTDLPFSVAGAVKMPNQAQFHPLKFAYALARDQEIYEHTSVRNIEGKTAITPNGKIRADKIIVATHFPLINRHGLYFLKLYQERSYVLGLRGVSVPRGIYIDESDKGLSFRSYGDTLLLGGGGHRTGKKGGGFEELRRVANEFYPNAREICHYATQDCIPLDDIAYIGRYSRATPSWYVASGYHKWGMTTSMVAANLLVDAILGKENPYAPIFSPERSILHRQLFVNMGESIMGLCNPRIPRCSHMGCALHYNRREHSWDCACHGSRFGEDGHKLIGPAKRGIRAKKPK